MKMKGKERKDCKLWDTESGVGRGQKGTRAGIWLLLISCVQLGRNSALQFDPRPVVQRALRDVHVYALDAALLFLNGFGKSR
jgi:hypothetical protein